jgi:Uma2 family endonuclease
MTRRPGAGSAGRSPLEEGLRRTNPMNIIPKPFDRATVDRTTLPLLVNGDRMGQAEFHRRYEAMPGDDKFELVGGIVYKASPTSYLHGLYHSDLSGILWLYASATPGVEGMIDTTAILGPESEPRPDLSLRIPAELGGRSHVDAAGYLTGPPELLAEVAYSSRAIDMNQKRQDYERAGVLEYLVLCVEEQELHWFSFATGGSILSNRKGVYCSQVFPGLWIHGAALLARDNSRVQEVLRQGLASRAHTALVKRLAKARRG